MDPIRKAVNRLIKQLDIKMDDRFERMDERFEKMDNKFENHKKWNISILITIILGFLALIAVVYLG